MAWFKNKVNNDIPQPVTLDRVARLFDAHEFGYDRVEDHILSGFDGFPAHIHISQDVFLSVGLAYHDFPLPPSRMDDLRQWVNKQNLDGSIGTSFVIVDDDGSISVASDHSLLVGEGATDEQLQNWVFICVDVHVARLQALCDDFNIPRPADNHDDV